MQRGKLELWGREYVTGAFEVLDDGTVLLDLDEPETVAGVPDPVRRLIYPLVNVRRILVLDREASEATEPAEPGEQRP
jgi:hypothetical protein